MKKLFLMLLATVSLIACNSGNGNGGENPPPTPEPEKNQVQTIYANEIQKIDAISFTAPQAWAATVSDVTARATNSEVEWLQLSAYSGEAGKQSLSLSLMPNFTGKSRKVDIKIVSGESIITISVEQKATTEDNKAPQYKTVKQMNSFKDGKADGRIEFTYDDQQRVVSCKVYNEDNSRNTFYDITYSASRIKIAMNAEQKSDFTFDVDSHGKVTYHEYLFENVLKGAKYTYNEQGYLTMYPFGGEVASSATGGEGESGNPPVTTHRFVYAENTWSGPNIISTIIDKGYQYSRSAKYEYTDKLNNGLASIDLTGGYKGGHFILLKDGSFGKRNRNLIKRETGTSTRDWSYEFDKQGNMTKFSVSNVEEGNRKWTESYDIIYN